MFASRSLALSPHGGKTVRERATGLVRRIVGTPHSICIPSDTSPTRFDTVRKVGMGFNACGTFKNAFQRGRSEREAESYFSLGTSRP